MPLTLWYHCISHSIPAHVFIDDGMELKKGKESEMICNRFVKQLVDVMELAAW